MKCPNCNLQAYLYKEIFEDGGCKIICLKCEWTSEKIMRHEDIKIETLEEQKKEWR